MIRVAATLALGVAAAGCGSSVRTTRAETPSTTAATTAATAPSTTTATTAATAPSTTTATTAATAPSTTTATPPSAATDGRGPIALRVERTFGRLPQARSGVAVAASGASVFVIGGLSDAGVSTGSVFRIDSAGRVSSATPLPGPVHDAATTEVGGRLLLFGGGQFEGSDRIVLVVPGPPRQIATLPQALSDLTAVTIGPLAYVAGGWNGTDTNRDIDAVAPSGAMRTVARLPVGVRYPAVAALDGRMIVAGGETASGAPTVATWSFDPASDHVTRLPDLPWGSTMRPARRWGTASICSAACATACSRARSCRGPPGNAAGARRAGCPCRSPTRRRPVRRGDHRRRRPLSGRQDRHRYADGRRLTSVRAPARPPSTPVNDGSVRGGGTRVGSWTEPARIGTLAYR